MTAHARLRRALPTLAGLALLAGCGSGDDGPPEARVERSTPPRTQLLAYATASEIGVAEPDGPRVLGRVPEHYALDALLWSADGRQLAWHVHPIEGSFSFLSMADVETGEVQRWKDVSGELAPSPHGVTTGQWDSRFVEYLPDGGRREYRVFIPLSKARQREFEAADLDDQSTSVGFAIPSDGDWLVAAQNTFELQAPEGQQPLLRYRVDRGIRGRRGMARGTTLRSPIRVDETKVAWVSWRGYECFDGAEPSGLGLHIPSLPARTGVLWETRRLSATGGTLDVIARPVSTGPAPEGQMCSDDGRGRFVWFQLRNGRWHEVERDLADVAIAADGRIARVPGTLEGIPEDGYLPDVAYGRATLETGDGTREALPAGIERVVFSPRTPVEVGTTAGSGPALDASATLSSRALGRLRLGDELADVRAATSTELTLAGTTRCGTLRAADLRTDARVGFRGTIAGGRLVRMELSSRDTPLEGEDDYPLDALQPNVKHVRPRGPRTANGFQAGTSLNELVVAEGDPTSRRTTSHQGAIDWIYRHGETTLVAHADAAAFVRRLELFEGDVPPACGG